VGANLTVQDIFRHPTVAELATVVASTGGDVDPVGRRDQGKQVSLSPAQWRAFAQRRLYRLDPVELGVGECLFQMALRLTGSLDTEALERARAEIIQRHEMLRTTFADDGGEPVQVTLPAIPFHLSVEELIPGAAGRAGAGGAQPGGRRGEAGLRPRGGLLLRTQLRWLGANDQVLLFTFHHLISDGWSVGVFLRELSALYNAFRSGRPCPRSGRGSATPRRRARSNAHARYQVGSFTATGLPSARFQAAVSIDSLWMVLNKPAAMREVAQILAPGSCWVCTTWEPAYFQHRNLLQDAGFEVLISEETPNWRSRQLAVYEGTLRERERLTAELGSEAAASVLIPEAQEIPGRCSPITGACLSSPPSDGSGDPWTCARD
jgi:hypothetical protein